MNLVKLSVEIHCNQPNWAKMQPIDPSYRLYLNNDLVTERTWKFGESCFINEEMYANLTHEQPCVIELEPLIKIPGFAEFYMTNFNTADIEHVILSSDDLSITFKLR